MVTVGYRLFSFVPTCERPHFSVRQPMVHPWSNSQCPYIARAYAHVPYPAKPQSICLCTFFTNAIDFISAAI